MPATKLFVRLARFSCCCCCCSCCAEFGGSSGDGDGEPVNEPGDAGMAGNCGMSGASPALAGGVIRSAGYAGGLAVAALKLDKDCGSQLPFHFPLI